MEDPGGDLRAVQGTTAELTVETDRPLKNGVIEMDDGSHINAGIARRRQADRQGAHAEGRRVSFRRKRAGRKRALERGLFHRSRAGRRAHGEDHASGLGREASVRSKKSRVAVEAADDFALQGVELHYSVNGGAEKVVPIPNSKGVAERAGKTLIALEDYKMEPGDVVALYATAKDARTTSRTDMMFIEAQPFERNYTQSQQWAAAAAAAEAGGDSSEISQRQKEIIAATWNELRGNAKDKAAENARFLSEVQTKLKEQAQSLAQRSRSRELAGANQEFQTFVKDLEAAAAEMGPASDKLKGQNWKDALGPEQRALQHLLRAEATFRDIQVAFGPAAAAEAAAAERRPRSRQHVRSGTGHRKESVRDRPAPAAAPRRNSARRKSTKRCRSLSSWRAASRNWRSSRTEQTADLRTALAAGNAAPRSRRAAQADGAVPKATAARATGPAGTTRATRPARASQGQSGQSGQSGSKAARADAASSAGNHAAISSRCSRPRSPEAGARTTCVRLSRCAQQNGQQVAERLQAEARRAAERLAEAQRMMNGMRQQQAGSQVDDLAERADKLAGQQNDFEQRLKQAFGSDRAGTRARRERNGTSPQTKQLADEKDKMAGELDRLEKDMQQAARDLAGTQPAAAGRVRDGLSSMQQTEAPIAQQGFRALHSQGLGRFMVPTRRPSRRRSIRSATI